ncbi:MAG: class I SAM-dependent methyltransferase [Phycisphaerae bacterium]|nr:class I SAM-dependent methyltransferase [Phycisphaerae bacterium]
MNERATHRAFDGLASTYEAHRPRYPAVIFDRLLDGVPQSNANVPIRALDVGCGTGISTRALAERAVDVIAMDPGEDMLERARAACAAFPTIQFVLGSAENADLPAEHVDLVLAAQAFHWFEPLRALAEFHRVLRPGGRSALLWNLRVGDGGFTDAYIRTAHGTAGPVQAFRR